MSSSQHTLPGPEDITRAQLANGIVVLSRSNFNSSSVVINGLLPAGALFDPHEKLGLADFTASALMRGTAARDFQEIYDILESAGASLGISSATHTVGFSGKALVEDLPILLTLAAEALRQPVFPPEQVERLRAQLMTSLAIRAQDTREMAELAFDQLIYRHHPYRHPEDGYPETIAAIRQEDLVAFHRKHYGPRGMILAIVGGIEPDRAVDMAAQAFGDWRNPAQPDLPVLPPLTPLETTTRRSLTIRGKSQADLVVGAAGPGRDSPHFLAAALGNNIFGQFGMMGRLGEVVREKAGLAYYAGSSLSGGPGPGPWDVTAGVDPQDIEQALDLIVQEIRRFTSQPVQADELADTQANFIGRLPISMESNSGVAGSLVYLERYQLGLDYYQRYSERIRAITRQDVLEAAQTYLDPRSLGVAVAGPGDHEEGG